MSAKGPRILLIGGTYRALCVLEHLVERGERVAAFIGLEGDAEQDFCAEILEMCDRNGIPARSGYKLGEEIVRWLEDRIRPDVVFAVGATQTIPLAIGGNCRLGLVEAVDHFQSNNCAGVALRRRGRIVFQRELSPPQDSEDAAEAYLHMVEALIEGLERFLDEVHTDALEPAMHVHFLSPSMPAEHPPSRRGSSACRPGLETRRLEQEVAAYLDADAVFALESHAQAFALLAGCLGLDDASEAIVSGLASAEVVTDLRSLGVHVVFADVEPERLTLDVERTHEAIGACSRALVISHTLGQPAPLDRLYSLAEEHGLEVIEDAGDALGARFAGSRIGRSPCACVFHFSLDAVASVGRIPLVALPAHLAERFEPRIKHLRISDAVASMGRDQLERWEDVLSARRSLASHYSAELVPYDAFRVPITPDDGLSTYAAYLLRLTRFSRTSAEDLGKLLGEMGIETRRLALAPGERELAGLPWTDDALRNGLLLPMRADLEPSQRDHLLDAIFGYAIG